MNRLTRETGTNNYNIKSYIALVFLPFFDLILILSSQFRTLHKTKLSKERHTFMIINKTGREMNAATVCPPIVVVLASAL